jgi:hypothetical protein
MLAGWFVPDMGIFSASGNGKHEENPARALFLLASGR